ncbi:pentapeptide repeat-containing protein [Pedococcus bigeumensis]|uniref:pentapeptide repeat-containing protein n=1 Tax=Pedococcus bigeumensis TaxID=433644 RepID=UPI0031D07C26
MIRDVVLALVIGAALLLGQNQLDERRANRQETLEAGRAQHAERVENLRFVRELSANRIEGSKLLLPGIDLAGTDLSGLDLSSADLKGANLSGAILIRTNLGGAALEGADLSGATLHSTNVEDVDLEHVDLTGAILVDENGQGPCQSERTRWPDGMPAPPARCPEGGA